MRELLTAAGPGMTRASSLRDALLAPWAPLLAFCSIAAVAVMLEAPILVAAAGGALAGYSLSGSP